MVPRKGYDVLLAAVAMLLDLQWRLTIVGELGRDAEATARLHADIARFNLADRVLLTGAIPADRLEALYASSDIFVLASRFEGYGMAFTEAIAHGLPVIGTTAGAIPETVPEGAGLLTPPDDIARPLVRGAAADRGFRGASQARRGGAGGGGRASHLGTGGGVVLACARDSRVTRFSADWLALREPYDARARNPDVLDALAAAVADRRSLAIIDLASGTGSTLRAIASRLPRRQRWRLVDHDPELLERASSALAAVGDVVTVSADIDIEVENVLRERADLVTASALLDLVSADWLDRLARATVRRRLLVYAALTYDGRVMFEPADPFDAEMVAAVNRHQRGDKGFGPALGPTRRRDADRAVRSAGLRRRPGRLGLGSRPRRTSKFKAICWPGGPRRRTSSGDLQPR